MTNDKSSALWAVLRPTGVKLAVSFVAAILLGGVGMYLYIFYQESDNLLPIIVAYAFCWPVILIGKLAYGPWPIYNFDPIIERRFGWLALSLYYYLIVSLVVAVRSSRRKRLPN